MRGSPEEVFPVLFKKWNVQKITWEIDTEPYAQTRDEKVERLARESGVEVVCCHGHTLYRTEKYGIIPDLRQFCYVSLSSRYVYNLN